MHPLLSRLTLNVISSKVPYFQDTTRQGLLVIQLNC